MAVVEVGAVQGGGQLVTFCCPGCSNWHGVTIGHPNNRGAQWTWNGDVDRPTISPSILSRIEYPKDATRDQQVCHSFVEGGNIRFLSDCTHGLAGQTVPLETIDE